MGTKKQAEKSKKLWIKVLAVLAGVVFVFLMVFSAMGSSWITSLASIKPGDVAVIEYTLQDAHGNPIVTTNQQLYTQISSKGYGIYYSKPITITANQTLTSRLFPVQVYTSSSGWTNQFAVFSNEYDSISLGIIGMHAHSEKTISLSNSMPLTQFWSAQQLAKSNLTVSSIQIGDLIPLGVSSNPQASQTNSTSDQYVRIGEVSNKTADGITIDFSYPTVDITVDSINQAPS